MKLIFSPYYGARPYVDLQGRHGTVFNEKAVGTAALLEKLELHMGFAGTPLSETDRLIHYVKAMRKALEGEPKLFFADSFRGDELGTAKVILDWRDALQMTLWAGEDGGSDRLHGLAAVEKHFDAPGPADRWRALVHVLEDGYVLTAGAMEIECRVPGDSLPPVIRRVLELLPKAGAGVSYTDAVRPSAPEGTALRRVQELLLRGTAPGAAKEDLPSDGTFRYYSFKYGYDAFQLVAGGMDPMPGRLLVVNDTKRLNDTLSALDRPLVGAVASGYPQSEQLFLLGLSLFRNPVDVNSLTSYLRVPVNPLGRLHVKKTKRDGTEYYRALNRELLDLLLKKGGLDGWTAVLDAAIYDDEGKVIGRKERETVLSRINMWESADASGRIPVEALQGYLQSLDNWAKSVAFVTEDEGLSALSSYCSAVLSLLEGRTGALDAETLTVWAKALLREVAMGSTPAGEGAFDTVCDIRDQVDGPRELIWLGCVGEEGSAYPYDFLSEQEINFVGAPKREDMARSEHRALVEGIASVRESLILVGYDIIDGTQTAEHPLMIELKTKAAFGPVPVSDYPEDVWETGTSRSPGTPQAEYKVTPSALENLNGRPDKDGNRKRRDESTTSLQTLIQRPFDYVLHYVLEMGSYGEAELQDADRIRGNVAHLYVERLITLAGKDVAAMEKLHAESFDSLILSCAQEKGAILLLEENGLKYTRFRQTLDMSVRHLLGLLRRNGLTVEGTEVELKTELPVIGPFVGYVDLLLKDAAGNYAIFDLKWNEGKYYYTKMEKGDILQLALYREAVGKALGGKVSFMGYWVLPKHELLTFEGVLPEQDDVVFYPDSGRNVFKEVCNSYEFRMEQLKKGLIEEAETLPLADLDYFQKQESRGLYPLESLYKHDDLKGRPIGNDNLTLKGGLI